MKLTIIYFSFIILITGISHSQNLKLGRETGNWFFGNNKGFRFDLNKNLPEAINGAFTADEGCAAISDSTGNLLFYANADTIWNRLNKVMKNGINTGGNSSSSQAVLIVRQPEWKNIFYVFSTEDLGGKFGYSIVDMNGDNGYGEVITKNVVVNDSSAEKLTAVMAKNMSDIWIITRIKQSSCYWSYQLTKKGFVSEPVLSQIDFNYNKKDSWTEMGCLKASPDGTLVAAATHSAHQFEIYDFDNLTGILSNPVIIKIDSSLDTYGISFSPDGTKLYVSAFNFDTKLYQYDLTSKNSVDIIKSEVILYESINDFGIGSIQAAVDGRLYVTKYQSDYISVINFPDSAGILCNFILNGINISGPYARLGLPNFPYLVYNYPSVPDTTKPQLKYYDSEIKVQDTTCYIGEKSYISIKYKLVNDTVILKNLSCRFNLEFPVDCFLPDENISNLTDNIIDNGMRKLTFNLKNIQLSNDEKLLLQIPGVPLLSSNQSFPVNISEFNWYDTIIKNNTISGTIKLKDICEFGLRNIQFLNPLKMEISPNPSSELSVISYQLSNDGYVKLTLVSCLGQEVAVLVNEEQKKGENNYQLSILNYQLSEGLYYVKLTSYNSTVTEKLFILK